MQEITRQFLLDPAPPQTQRIDYSPTVDSPPTPALLVEQEPFGWLANYMAAMLGPGAEIDPTWAPVLADLQKLRFAPFGNGWAIY